MRTLHLTSSYPESHGDPAGHFIEAEAREAAREHTVTVVAPLSVGTRQRFQEGRLTVIRLAHGGALGWPGAGVRLSAHPQRAWGYLAWIHAAAREILAVRPEELYIHWPVPNGLALERPFARGDSAHITWVSHGADIRLLINLPAAFRSQILRRWLPRIHRWRFVSTSLYESLEGVLSVAEARALAFKANIEAPAMQLPSCREIAAAGARTTMACKRPLLVSVGRLIPSKRVDDAFPEVARSGGSLVVIGDGPERTRLERIAKEVGAEVHFTGKLPRAEALSWIARADELLMTSEAEGLSTVVREAEALGTRVRWLTRNVT